MSDNSWFLTGDLPPIGARVDVIGFVVYGVGEVDCEVVSHVEDCAVIRMSYGLGCFESENLKPTMTDREKFIDAAISCLSEFKSANQVFGEMYDVGFRLPDAPK